MSIVRDGWSKRGQKTYGDRHGKKGTRTSLIAGKRRKELLASALFKGSTNALWFNQWLEEDLILELKPNSTLILDNAAFHRKDDVFRIAEQTGHKVLFLPPYSPRHAKHGKRPFNASGHSPCFNRIKQDFAILKKRRIYSAPDISLDDIVKSYGNYLE